MHRDVKRSSEDTEQGPLPQGRNIIVTIGIDDYQHWPKLRNAVTDAQGVQRLLVEKSGNEVGFGRVY
jgi:hypothetical protein